jgi:arginase
VQPSVERFSLALSYPQWQGSGRSAHLRRGAQAAARVCGEFAPLEIVRQSGEGEARGGVNRWTAIVEQFHSAREILAARQPARVLTAGGDCACDVAVIDYLHRRYPDLFVIWIDAHLDANTPSTTPSGNFHGMPVATLLGSAPADMRELLGPALDPERFRYVAAHVGDGGDWDFQKERGLRWYETGQPIAGPVHVHFDLDALDPAEFPHVAYPDGKLAKDAGLSLVRDFARTGNLVGLTITEFAPADQAGEDDGSRYIKQICQAATVDTAPTVA